MPTYPNPGNLHLVCAHCAKTVPVGTVVYASGGYFCSATCAVNGSHKE